MDRPTPD
jgi:hypothetical protein